MTHNVCETKDLEETLAEYPLPPWGDILTPVDDRGPLDAPRFWITGAEYMGDGTRDGCWLHPVMWLDTSNGIRVYTWTPEDALPFDLSNMYGYVDNRAIMWHWDMWSCDEHDVEWPLVLADGTEIRSIHLCDDDEKHFGSSPTYSEVNGRTQ